MPRDSGREPVSDAIRAAKIATGEIVEEPTADCGPVTAEEFIRTFDGGNELVEKLKKGEHINTDGCLKIGSGFPPSKKPRKQ